MDVVVPALHDLWRVKTKADLCLTEHPLHKLPPSLPDFCHHVKGLKGLLQQMSGMHLLASCDDGFALLLSHGTLTPHSQYTNQQLLSDTVQALRG